MWAQLQGPSLIPASSVTQSNLAMSLPQSRSLGMPLGITSYWLYSAKHACPCSLLSRLQAPLVLQAVETRREYERAGMIKKGLAVAETSEAVAALVRFLRELITCVEHHILAYQTLYSRLNFSPQLSLRALWKLLVFWQCSDVLMGLYNPCSFIRELRNLCICSKSSWKAL